jgi:ABC-type sugar transport system ATPase subunit
MTGAEATRQPVLELTGIGKEFGAIRALHDVDMQVYPGEVVGLMGDNGAGKSTLVKIIAGNFKPSHGEIRFDGNAVHFSRPIDARAVGIEVVYQDLALCDNLDVVSNMYLGREAHNPFQVLNEAVMEQKTAQTLKSLAVTTIRSIRQTVATLSGGQRQSVAVARAVMWNSKVVILDEPTAALGVAEVRKVVEFVRRIKQSGRACIYIEHNLAHVHEVADRLIVLDRGRVVSEISPKDMTVPELTEYLIALQHDA